MNQSLKLSHPLQNLLISTHQSVFKQILMLTLGVFLLAFASQLSIPLKPVPLTFQSATVLLIGMMYGSRQGSLVVGVYLLIGALGIPVFADFSAGFHYFWGATSGYLIGFVPAAFVAGFLAERGFAKNPVSSFIAALIGASILFTTGIIVLSKFVGFKAAIQLGLMPFVISELIKLIAVSVVAPRAWKKS